MGIFDRFPYSSTHEMNLDYMLGKATEIAEDMQQVTAGMEQVQAGLSAISEKTEQATQAAAQAAQSASSIEGSVTAAEEAAEEAQMHNESAQTWANNAMTYKADCQRSATEAAASSSSAAQAATAAAASEDTVATYAQAANASAQSAANNNDSAHQYANQASASASNATFHSSNAQTAATNAQTAATNAQTAATRTAALKDDCETLHRMCTAAVDQAATEAVNAANSAAQAASTKTDVETLVESLPEDFTDLNNTVNQLSEDIVDVKNFLGFEEATTTTVYKSIADNQTSNSLSTVSPFIINMLDYSNAPYSITGIKMNISQAGVMTVGRVLKSKVTVNNTFNIDDFSDSQTINIASTGAQDIPLTPIEITDDYYLFVNIPGDTVRFYYGGDGTGLTPGFIYVTNDVYTTAGSFLGIDMFATSDSAPSNVRDAVNSIYKDKKLSILGDSISTFSGYIPEGNATYYPSGTVTSVTDTWWYKLYTALGMTLDTNNSWSGSRVTTTAGEASAGCMTRCQNLGFPDVIIVWMGINDFNNEVQIGTYDGTSEMPSTTSTFREAYAVMLNKILMAYQRAEIWVCTLPQCERNAEAGFPELNRNGDSISAYNKAIRELADAFGVKVLEHNKCGLTYQNMPVYNPDNLHPNKYGHSLVANNDIWQMDNTIAKRYSIS